MLASSSLLLIKCSTKAQRNCTSAPRMLPSLGNPPRPARPPAHQGYSAIPSPGSRGRAEGCPGVGSGQPPGEGDMGWSLLARMPSADGLCACHRLKVSEHRKVSWMVLLEKKIPAGKKHL